MSQAIIDAINAAATWQEALAAIKDNADVLLDQEHLGKLDALPDDGGREQAIGLGVNEIKSFFGPFATLDDVKDAVAHQIDVEHAKFAFIEALDDDAVDTPAEMTAAIEAVVGLVNQHRQDLIATWDAIEGNDALAARVAELKADTYTLALAEIVSHLDDATYMAELGARVLAARDALQGGNFFGVYKIVDAFLAANDAIEADHDATITGVTTGALTEDDIADIFLGTLSVQDEDWGEDAFQAVAEDDLQKEYGTFTFNHETGAWTFTLNNVAAQSLAEGEEVEQTLTVTSHDGSATQTITVTVTGANDAPTAAADGNSASGDEDKILTGELPEAADVDGDNLTYELVAPVAGLTLNADGTFRYVPAADFNGNVVFQYVVKDPHGGETEARTFTLTIKPVNDAPRDITLSSSKVAENSAAATEVGKLTVSDPEGGQFTYELVDSANGRFTIDATGTLKVAEGTKLDYEQATSHTVKVRVKDAAGATFEKSLTIDVTDVAVETVTGTATDDVLKGGVGKDVFNGGLGNDKLSGGLGNDTLTGGKGKDAFIFDTKLGTSKTDRKVNFDKIKDFSVKDDSLYLDNAIFKKLGKKGTADKPAKLSKSFFTIGDKAKDKNDYIVYNNKTGVLSYDADGSGKGKAVEFAQLSKKLALTYKDFFVI